MKANLLGDEEENGDHLVFTSWRLVQENGLLGLSGRRLKMRRNGGTLMASLAKGEGELEGLAEMGEELDEEGGLIGEREGVVARCVCIREKRKKKGAWFLFGWRVGKQSG